MLKNYKMTISYDGTRYDGWQKQKNTENTIQGKLETLLSRMAGTEISVHGSGRTDAGVHALGQTANFRMDTELSEKELLDAVNEYLPDGAVGAHPGKNHTDRLVTSDAGYGIKEHVDGGTVPAHFLRA